MGILIFLNGKICKSERKPCGVVVFFSLLLSLVRWRWGGRRAPFFKVRTADGAKNRTGVWEEGGENSNRAEQIRAIIIVKAADSLARYLVNVCARGGGGSLNNGRVRGRRRK